MARLTHRTRRGEPPVYLRPYAGASTGVEKQVSGTSRRLSSDGGDQPRWRVDGKELFYISAEGKVIALFHKSGPPFIDATATTLFALATRRTAQPQFDVSGAACASWRRFHRRSRCRR